MMKICKMQKFSKNQDFFIYRLKSRNWPSKVSLFNNFATSLPFCSNIIIDIT